MKILLTGGNGFIARSLAEALCESHDVISADRSMLDLMDAEKVSGFLKKNCFDVVIHSATYDAAPSFSTKDPHKVLENNLRMFFNIVRCKEDFGRMIFFGSGAEFGKENWKPGMKESCFDIHVPNDQYGLSKYIMTKHTLATDRIYNLRLFGVFGKYDDWRYRFIPNACCQAVLNMPITIRQNARYDFVYIDDLTAVVEWVITNEPACPVYNVCSGKAYAFRELAEMIIKVSGKELPINIEKNALIKVYSGDNSQLLKEMPGFRFTPMEHAIKSLYYWYENHMHLFDKAEFAIS